MAKELDPNYVAPDDGYVHDDTFMLQNAVDAHYKYPQGQKESGRTPSKQEIILRQK